MALPQSQPLLHPLPVCVGGSAEIEVGGGRIAILLSRFLGGATTVTAGEECLFLFPPGPVLQLE